MDDLLQKAAEDIYKNHLKIIDDWCKAYLAHLYQKGVSIDPGCFTLNQMGPYFDEDKKQMITKYWFTSGKPEFDKDYGERI